MVVLFGFTNCDAICPAGMSKLTRLLDRFDAEGYAARITPIFISVDPHRDDPKTIANYLESFHPRFVGLTGSNDELTSATIQFKTYFQATNRSPKEGEQLTHSTAMYVLDPYGRIVGLLPQQQSFEDSVSLLKTFLKS